MVTKIQIRRGTAAEWVTANPTLFPGEQGYETDTGKMKIGDGATSWTSLLYYGGDVDTSDFATAAQGGLADTAVQPADIANFETTTQLNSRDTGNRNRANHTGTQSADTITDGTTNKAYTATEKTKLSGIATAATANDTDANLKNRANHTGAQAISTVTGLQTALDAKADDADLASYVTTAAAAELIRDTMGTALVAGANVTVTVNDAGDTITIAAFPSGIDGGTP